MKIAVLYISECPNHARAVESIREILLEYELPQEITEIQVTGPAQAIDVAESPSA